MEYALDKVFLNIVDQSSDSVLITDINGRIEYVNQKFLDITGYTREEVIGNTPRMLRSGRTTIQEYREMWNMVLSGKSWRGVFMNRTKQGKYYWEESLIFPVPAEDGSATRLVGIKKDITGEKKLQEKGHGLLCKQSSSLFKFGLRIFNFITGEYDYSLGMDYASNLVTDHRFMHIQAADLEQDRTQQKEALTHKRTKYASVLGVRLHDGSMQHLEKHCSIEYDNNQNPVKSYEFYIDVTGQHKFYRDDSINCKQLAEMFENKFVGTFFMMLDEPVSWDETTDKKSVMEYVFSHQRITAANRVFFDQYKGDEHEVIGLTPTDFFQHDIDYGKDVWTRVFDNGFLEIDTIERKLDGSRMHIFGSYICIYDGDDRITGHFGIQFEITDASGAARTRFLAGVSHELRAPLNAVMRFASLALKPVSMGQQDAYIRKIIDSSQELLRVVDNLIDISCIKSGKFKLACIPFNIYESVKEVTGQMQQQADEKSIKILQSLSEDIPERLYGDPVRFQQLLFNIMDNAVKYTPRGSVRCTAAVTDRRRSSISLLFTVADTGMGIQEEYLDIVFEPFFKGTSSGIKHHIGKGLGLPVARHLAAVMNGDIHVESEFGRGSTVSFTVKFLTVNPERGEAEPDGIPEDSEIAMLKEQLTGVRVLLVEDNEINQGLVLDILKQVQAHVTVTSTGEGAVSALHDQEFDLVLMDLHLPGVSGYEAVRTIRERKDPSQLPVIAITADFLPEEPEKSLQAGINEYISKPVDFNIFFRKLSKWYHHPLKRQHGSTPGPSEYLDTVSAVDRLGGDQEVYLNILERFQSQHVGQVAQFADSADLGDWPTAERIAHTLKGIAGYIGADSLYEVCLELEKASREGRGNMIPPLFEKMELEISHAEQAIASYLSEYVKPETETIQELSDAEIHDAFLRLIELLKHYDLEALDLFRKINTSGGCREMEHEMSTAKYHIENYDFDGALSFIESCCNAFLRSREIK